MFVPVICYGLSSYNPDILLLFAKFAISFLFFLSCLVHQQKGLSTISKYMYYNALTGGQIL